jgi:DNA-binding PadR family transcriptional regulator
MWITMHMDNNVFIHKDIVSYSSKLFSVLSDPDNLKMFVIAKDGLKISTSTLYALEITPKKYYSGLKKLKDAGLIEKKKKKEAIYIQTTFGSIVYQRNVVEMAQYAEHLQKMQMIDTIRQTEKFSEAAIAKVIEEIIPNAVVSSSISSLPSHPHQPSVTSNSNDNYANNIANVFPTVDVILSFDKVIQTLVERIDCCKSEILIATRICPEIVINKLLEKSKLGVKIKVVADIDLVKEYFRSQQEFVDDLDKKNPIKERKFVVANPWYPDNSINRRIMANIPLGMIDND